MVRTQIYLTEEERRGLDDLSKATGRKQSELIREAVDQFLDLAQGKQRETILREVAGLWSDRSDLPGFVEARRSWNRG